MPNTIQDNTDVLLRLAKRIDAKDCNDYATNLFGLLYSIREEYGVLLRHDVIADIDEVLQNHEACGPHKHGAHKHIIYRESYS